MKPIANAATATLCLLSLSGCASIIAGSTDHVNLVTVPPTSAQCTLTNARESVTSAAPSTVAIKKSRTDLNVSCTDPQTNATGQTKLASEIEPWDFGNIIIGGLIGIGVDWATGAAYNYPDAVSVPMTASATPSMMPQAVMPVAPMPEAVPQAAAPVAPPVAPAYTPMPYNAPAPVAAPVYAPAPNVVTSPYAAPRPDAYR